MSLLETLDHDGYRLAIEADLMAVGTRLRHVGTDVLTWREVYAVVKNSAPGSALYRAQQGDDSPWGLTEMLLAETVDALNVANWIQGSGKKSEYPNPIPRPGVGPEKIGGKGALPVDEMAEWLGWDTGGYN